MAMSGSLGLQPSVHSTFAERRCSPTAQLRPCHLTGRAQRCSLRAACAPLPRGARLGMTKATAQQAEAPSAQQGSPQPEVWYALVANSEFMFNDAQNEALAEQLREKKRFYGEQNKDLDFFIISEPAWLDEKYSSLAKQVRRPCAALVSTDQMWITFMKLRLDRVLKLELTGLSRQEVFQSGGPVPDFTPPEKWTAPYSPYRKGWWEAFQPDKLGLLE